ncbi:MAG: hypothetical protein ABII89_02245 [Candidatus Omnitrophota bacterium]
MIITKKRIRNIDPYIQHIPEGSRIVIGIVDLQRFFETLKKIGFVEPYSKGQSLLPAGVFGPVSLYNAEGKNIAHKDEPMETAYREAEWRWTEWHGRYDRIEQSKIVYVPYKRYPRTFVKPPSIEFTINVGLTGQLFLTTPDITKVARNRELLTHIANLFLEIFGECQFFTENLEKIVKPSTIRLNWEILPRGKMPWEQLKKHIAPLIEQAPKGNQFVLLHRLGTINKMKPDFRAIGRGGFHGYIVHGFTENNIYILESMYYGNATYVFGETWEDLSKKTKAEILNQELQKDRIIHYEGWEERVKNLLDSPVP